MLDEKLDELRLALEDFSTDDEFEEYAQSLESFSYHVLGSGFEEIANALVLEIDRTLESIKEIKEQQEIENAPNFIATIPVGFEMRNVTIEEVRNAQRDLLASNVFDVQKRLISSILDWFCGSQS